MEKIKRIEKLHKSYTKLSSGIKNHNILQSEASLTEIMDLQDGFWEDISENLEQVSKEVDSIKNLYLLDQGYVTAIYNKLIEKDIPVTMNEADLLIGPMLITFHIDEYYIQVTIGRKKQRIAELEPNIVIKKLEMFYRKLNSSFNANTFFKRLLKAYDFINTRMYSSRETKYGYSVALKDIFDLFALSPSANFYKIENFLWDLGRLVSTADTFSGHRIELGFSRDVKKMYLIKTTSGEELRASTITIHERINDDEHLE